MEYEPTKKSGLYSAYKGWGSLLWWQVTPEELEGQVENYSTLKITQSARGLSFLLCILSFVLTLVIVALGTKAISVNSAVIEGIIFLILGFSIYKGQRWAIIAMMLLWTLEKAIWTYDLLALPNPNSLQAVLQIIWWCTYMHSFYVSLTVENMRRNIIKGK